MILACIAPFEWPLLLAVTLVVVEALKRRKAGPKREAAKPDKPSPGRPAKK